MGIVAKRAAAALVVTGSIGQVLVCFPVASVRGVAPTMVPESHIAQVMAPYARIWPGIGAVHRFIDLLTIWGLTQ